MIQSTGIDRTQKKNVMQTLIDWCLLLGTGALILSTLRMAMNRTRFHPLLPGTPRNNPQISILVPARNEERSLPRLIDSLRKVTYPDIEILILDDGSTDATPQILETFRKENPDQVRILSGKSLPDGWLGKPWACHQLAGHATGSFLLFLDADVTIRPDTVSRLLHEMERSPSDLLTVWPIQELETRWEKILIPMVYHALVTLLPIEAINRRPWWMPLPIYSRIQPYFGAACGQCLFFTREAYDGIGGHRTVRNEVVDDVMLARAILSAGRTIRMATGHESVSCRMYHSKQDIHSGFRKNFLAGFDHRISLFLLSGIAHAIIQVLPFLMLPAGLWNDQPFWILFSTLSIVLILLQRMWLAVWFRWNPFYAWTHPIAVGWFQLLGLQSIGDYLTGNNVLWKGRPV
ncbi:MAG: glycosyltransferase family 2 protein [Balneolaceae bacterium]